MADENPTKEKNEFGGALSWFFAVFFILATLGSVSQHNYHSGVSYALIVAALLPPVRKLAYKLTKTSLSPRKRLFMILVLVLFSMWAVVSDTLKEGAPAVQESPKP